MSVRSTMQRFTEPRLCVPAVLALFAAALPTIGYFAYGYDLKVLGFPLGIGLFAVIMGLFSIRAELAAPTSAAEAPPAPPGAFDESEGLLENRDTWIQVGWIALFAVAVWVLGFLAGPSIMLALYLMWDGRGLRTALTAAILMAAAVWLISTHLIRAPLPLLPVFWS